MFCKDVIQMTTCKHHAKHHPALGPQTTPQDLGQARGNDAGKHENDDPTTHHRGLLFADRRAAYKLPFLSATSIFSISHHHLPLQQQQQQQHPHHFSSPVIISLSHHGTKYVKHDRHHRYL
jgi:hypothetical protein